MKSNMLLQFTILSEPDLKRLTELLLMSVTRLGGSRFHATVAVIEMIQLLRQSGAASGDPVEIELSLYGSRLLVRWNKMPAEQESYCLARLSSPPALNNVQALRQVLADSVRQIDPEVLQAQNRQMRQYFETEQKKTEQALAQLQQSFEQRQKELEQATLQAETDGLTGLLNRRSFDTRIKQAFLYTMRQRQGALSLLMFDLDNFKQLNDTYGHQYGDNYLIKMAAALRDVIRENVDLAFRFGGDEFAVLLFADSGQARYKAQQVLDAMNHKVSIGIADIHPHTSESLTLEAFIRRADDALYRAKRQGRGRIVIDD